jgi:8-oxo-dGTP diphosphatase
VLRDKQHEEVHLLTGALAIILRQGKILMIERGTEPHLGYLCPPGGVQEEEESLNETVRREVKEETGLEVEVVEELGRVIGPITGKPHSLYLCRLIGGRLKPSYPEAIDARWILYEEINRRLIPPFIKDFLATLDLTQLERNISHFNTRVG